MERNGLNAWLKVVLSLLCFALFQNVNPSKQQDHDEEKLVMRLPEAEVQSFAVTLRYMYTDCIFPLVKGEKAHGTIITITLSDPKWLEINIYPTELHNQDQKR